MSSVFLNIDQKRSCKISASPTPGGKIICGVAGALSIYQKPKKTYFLAFGFSTWAMLVGCLDDSLSTLENGRF